MKKELLEKVVGDLVVSDSNKVAESKNTIASRKKAWREAVEAFDIEKLVELQEEMDKFVDKMKVLSKMDSDGAVVLDSGEAKDLMVEFLASKNIAEFLEARKSMVREMVFQSITEKHREAGEEDPENINGVIEVPELKKKFCKEGAGYKDPVLDQAKLRELLGDKYESVVVKRVIPEKVEYELSEDLLVKLAESDESVVKAIRDSVVPGSRKTPRFQVRDMR